MSGDGTTHRSINMESRFATLRAPDYLDPSKQMKHVQRFLGVQSTDSHSSQAQLTGLQDVLGDFVSTYNEFMASEGVKPTRAGFLLTLCMGMNSDHANDQKALARMVEDLKKEEAFVELADTAIKAKEADKLLTYVCEENERKLAAVGGIEGWNRLSANECRDRDAEALRAAVVRIGKDAYDKLSPEDRDALGIDLFAWVGCCMHKDLNCTKSGSTAMSAYWSANKRTPPRLLMNRDKAAAVKNVPSSTASAPTQVNVPNKAVGGAIKLIQLIGALLNHKDDKKGEHNLARHYFLSIIGILLMFPDVSNIRYGSYGEAACVILLYRQHLINYLEMIRDRKNTPGLNHLEQNVYNGLQDIPTIVELIPLAANAIAVSQHYMAHVRSSSSNGLDLGSWHEKVKAHVHHLATNPDLILKADPASKELCLDAQPLHRPEVLQVLQHEAANLPQEDVVGTLSAFFGGSSAAWERFTEEYAPTGTIASLTPVQRDRAFMATTNDVNEGALGHYRLTMRKTPRLTLLHYNSMMMYKKNLTSGYIKRHFGAKEHAYLRQKARFLDKLGLEKQRRQILAVAAQKKTELNRIKIREKGDRAAQKRLKRAEEMAGVTLELDPERLRGMSSTDLCKQLVLWCERVFKKKELPMASKCTKKPERLAACLLAIQRFNDEKMPAQLLDDPASATNASEKEAEAMDNQHDREEDPMDTDSEYEEVA